MPAAAVPDVISRLTHLGTLEKYYPSRGARWFEITLGVLFFLMACALVGWGTLEGFLRYYHFGPAVVLRTLALPAAGVVAALLLGWLMVRRAMERWRLGAGLFTGGIAYRSQKAVTICRWHELENVRADVSRRDLLGIALGTSHRYTLKRRDGKVVVLDDRLKAVGELGQAVLDHSFKPVYSECAKGFNSGRELDFGLVKINRRALCAGEKSWTWDTVRRIETRDGWLRVFLSTDKGEKMVLKAPVARIDNPGVLTALLDQIVIAKN